MGNGLADGGAALLNMNTPCDFVAPIRRSKEIKAVCAGLHAQVEAGVIRSFQEGKLRVGRMNIDVDWPDGRVSQMRIDTEAATLTLSGFIEASAGSGVVRELKSLLRSVQSVGGELQQQLRIDPSKAMLRLTEQGGKLSLAIIVTSDEYQYCTRRLIELAQEAFALLRERGYCSVALTSVQCLENTA